MRVLNKNVVYVEVSMRVLNKRYWPKSIKVAPTKIEEAQRWCYENFKSRDWRDIGICFYFKREHDATLFALRWS